MSKESLIGRGPELISKQGNVVASSFAKESIKVNRELHSENELNQLTERTSMRFKDLRGDLDMDPDISIVIPAYNEEKFVLQLLDSISKQKTNRAVEVIMEINDSSDRTAEICRKCGVVVDEYQREENYPPVAYARQRGLEKARGKVVVSIDADMVCGSENYLENLTKPLFEKQDIVLTCGGIKHYDGKWLLMLNPIETMLRKRKIYKGKEAIGVGFSNMAFKRDIALDMGGWPQSPISEDIGLIEKIMTNGEVEVVKKATVRASGRRQMISIREQIRESKKGGNHFYDKEGDLKVVR